jgi:hypothetical protein
MPEWIKFKKTWPMQIFKRILYYDSKENNITIANITENGIYSDNYYCNDIKCNWIYDDCNCKLIIDPNDQWMVLPTINKE